MKKTNLIDKYTYRVEWSEDDNVHIARCLEFPSLMAHGSTPAKALAEIEKVVGESMCWLEEEKEPISEPCHIPEISGRIF
jgi:predicted RNase H-like HicB family nuclease